MNCTYLFVLWDAHDPHCIHCLCEQVLILLPRNSDVPVGKEAVVVVVFQKELLCKEVDNKV